MLMAVEVHIDSKQPRTSKNVICEDDDTLYDETLDNKEYKKIKRTKFEFARNNNGAEYGRLLVQQTDDPNEICEYLISGKKNSCKCLKCQAYGSFVFFAPVNHEPGCFKSKSEVIEKQRIISRTKVNDEKAKSETDGRKHLRSSNEDVPARKRTRRNEDVEIEEPKTFASTQSQTDELYMCNLSNRPTQLKEHNTEVRCIVNIHGFKKDEIDAEVEDDVLTVIGEHNINNRSILCQITLPENVEMDGYKVDFDYDHDLCTFIFPKMKPKIKKIKLTF
uniref:SHSP domain-containing protein n=1 Tax=Panagrolaimus davidi TaxID=227884 RepID=A0A914NXY7_9BILA